MRHIYKQNDGCIKLQARVAFLAGEFSSHDFSELLFHTDECPVCLEMMNNMEAYIDTERPLFYLDEALNKPRTPNCLSYRLMRRLARRDVKLSSASSLYATYHLRFCARCYALFCQLLRSERIVSADKKTLHLILPVNTLNEKLLGQIVGGHIYNLFREGLRIKPGDYIYNFLIRSESLNQGLLIIEYEKTKDGFVLSHAHFNQEDYFVDGIEAIYPMAHEE